MHETVLHKCSTNRKITSPTCMLIYFPNIPFMLCMHCLSLFLSFSFTMHFINLLAFSFPSVSRANLGLVSTFIKAALSNLDKEYSPSSLDFHNLALQWTPGLNFTFQEVNDFLAPKFMQLYPRPTVTTSWDCALCNPNYQLPDLIAQFLDPTCSSAP